eukprot:SAG11_NODE_2488_length_3295_cov_4.463079_2_plen_93_part_00
MVNATHPDMAEWAEELIEVLARRDLARYKCFDEMTGDQPPTGEPLRIEDREGDDLNLGIIPPVPAGRRYCMAVLTAVLETYWRHIPNDDDSC